MTKLQTSPFTVQTKSKTDKRLHVTFRTREAGGKWVQRWVRCPSDDPAKARKYAEALAELWVQLGEPGGLGDQERRTEMILDHVRYCCRLWGCPFPGEAVGQTPLWASFAREWLDRKADGLKPASRVAYEAAVARFTEFLGDGGAVQMGLVDPAMAQRYYDSLVAELSAGSAKNLMVPVRSVFERARKMGLLPRGNPFDAVEKAVRIKAVRRAFTEEEIERVLDYLTGENAEPGGLSWANAVLLGRHLGLRLGDVAALRYSAVQNVSGVWCLCYKPAKKDSPGKSAPELRVPLPSVLDGLPDEKDALGDDAPICPALHGRAVGGANGLSAEFAKILESAGIVRRDVSPGDGRARKAFDLGFHSLRHTCVTRLTEAGVSEAVRMLIVGHSSADVHRGYQKLDVAAVAAEMEKIKALARPR